MSVDTMLEAGWPAQMVDHAEEIERARGLAHMEVGWYWSHHARLRGAGGPAPQAAIDDAVDMIARCALLGLPAPMPFPMPDDTCGIELDWAVHSRDMCSLEWVAPGMWQIYLDSVDGSPQLEARVALEDVRRQLKRGAR